MAIATDTLTRDKLFIGGEWVEPAGTARSRSSTRPPRR